MGAGKWEDTPGQPEEGTDGADIMADTSQTWDQATVQAMTTNLKRIVDEWAAISQNKASQQAGLQDQVNGLFLKWAMDAQGVTNRVANDAATVSARIASNAASVDNMVLAAAITNPAELSEAAIGAKVAEEVSSTAKDAIKAAVAAVPGTSAASQGTAGVAQGALQTQAPIELAGILNNNITIQTAILKALADINTSLGVILVKVTGEEVTAEQPAA